MKPNSEARKRLEAERVGVLYQLGQLRTRENNPDRESQLARLQARLTQIDTQLASIGAIGTRLQARRAPVARIIRRFPSFSFATRRLIFLAIALLAGYIAFAITSEFLVALAAGICVIIMLELFTRRA